MKDTKYVKLSLLPSYYIIDVFFRNIFERVTTLSLSSKKMQFFFKRYIQFEEQHGTAATIKTVRNKAMEYAESKFVES